MNKNKFKICQKAYEKIKNNTNTITYHDCVSAAYFNGEIISSVPHELITEELCVIALTNNPSMANLIQYIPEKFLTEDFLTFMESCKNNSNPWKP